MKYDIKTLFNKKQPLIWQHIYSQKIKEFGSVHPSKLVGLLSDRLKKNLESSRSFTDTKSREYFHVQKDISFIFRIMPVLHETYEFDLNYFTKTGYDILKSQSSSRVKTDILYFLSKLKSKINISSEILAFISLNDQECFHTKFKAILLLCELSMESFLCVVEKTLKEDPIDSIFLKKKIASLLILSAQKNNRALIFLDKLIDENKPFVLQGIAESLHLFGDEKITLSYYEKIVLTSDSSIVCSAIQSLFLFLQDRDSATLFNKTLDALAADDSKVSMFAIKSAQQYLIELKRKDAALFRDKLNQIFPILKEIIGNSDSLPVCNLSKMVLERLWLESDEPASHLYYKLKNILNGKKRSKGIKVGKEIFNSYNDETIGRVLSVLSQENFSIQFIRTVFGGIKLVKDAFFKFRLWRFVYEFLHPSPLKRQTLSNSVGRHFTGRLRSASCILSEEAKSGIPGEPVEIKSEASSRPFLPLIDDFLSAVESKEEYKIFSPEGMTIITPPQNIFKRILSEASISFDFKNISDLRVNDNDSYLNSFRKRGYKISIKAYSNNNIFSCEPSKRVKRFFTLAFLAPSEITKCVENMKSYFFSIYTNTLHELGVFILAFFALFACRHFAINMFFRAARNSFPLCIGGWGTRGKSSVERLKTALFLSIGCSVFSKTSGSEASFTYTDSYYEPSIIPIFRPYEKATISEQLKFVRLASKFKTEVFLWECMAIAPRYVKVMQSSWMRDDISTITNTYPDHEDAQGPSGWNIAESMTNFIPANASLITTEKEMYPFLEDEAARKGTLFNRVDEFATFTLTPDIQNLFPYKEHPKNICLVLRLAEMLGIDRDIALKGMIDNVEPDIGALKEFPPVLIENKKILFISGMSANEKTACLYNWDAMKMNVPSMDEKIVTATLINNRGDRPLRTKVFAEMLIKDLNADIHFLAGTNLNAFMMHLKKACEGKLTKSETESLMSKFVLIKDSKIEPYELFKIFASHIPDGYSMRIMGIENIKGIGIRICRWLEERTESPSSRGKRKGSIFFSTILSFVDPLFIVFRKRQADAIYKKLSKNSIAKADAVIKLKKLISQ